MSKLYLTRVKNNRMRAVRCLVRNKYSILSAKEIVYNLPKVIETDKNAVSDEFEFIEIKSLTPTYYTSIDINSICPFCIKPIFDCHCGQHRIFVCFSINELFKAVDFYIRKGYDLNSITINSGHRFDVCSPKIYRITDENY